MEHAIVCEDASRTHAPGTIITGPRSVEQAQRKGSALLPYDAELPRLANMGFVLNYFGEGWLFERNQGERGCPGIVQVNDRCQYLYWAARVAPVEGKAFSGQLRLVHSSENSRGFARGMRQLVYPKAMPPIDDRGGVTVFGKSGFNPGAAGLMFTELYATSPGMVVKWMAVSQHWEDIAL